MKRHCGTGEPCALKGASTVRRGADGNVLSYETTRKENLACLRKKIATRQPPTLHKNATSNTPAITENKIWLPPSYYNNKAPIAPAPKKKGINWGFADKTLWDWIQFFAVLAIPIIVAA